MRYVGWLWVLAGCESVKSGDVATSSIWADFSATSEGEGTRAQAVLRVGGETSNTYVELEDGDTLSATVGAETTDLTLISLGELKVYVADFAADEADTPVSFAFTRAVDDGAPSSTTSIPAPFEVTAPAPDTAFSRTQDAIPVTWEPSGSTDTMLLRLRSDCILDAEVSVDGDPGAYTFEAGSLEPIESQEGNACEAELLVERRRYGDLDPAFTTGGSVYAAHARTVSLRLDP